MSKKLEDTLKKITDINKLKFKPVKWNEIKTVLNEINSILHESIEKKKKISNEDIDKIKEIGPIIEKTLNKSKTIGTLNSNELNDVIVRLKITLKFLMYFGGTSEEENKELNEQITILEKNKKELEDSIHQCITSKENDIKELKSQIETLKNENKKLMSEKSNIERQLQFYKKTKHIDENIESTVNHKLEQYDFNLELIADAILVSLNNEVQRLTGYAINQATIDQLKNNIINSVRRIQVGGAPPNREIVSKISSNVSIISNEFIKDIIRFSLNLFKTKLIDSINFRYYSHEFTGVKQQLFGRQNRSVIPIQNIEDSINSFIDIITNPDDDSTRQDNKIKQNLQKILSNIQRPGIEYTLRTLNEANHDYLIGEDRIPITELINAKINDILNHQYPYVQQDQDYPVISHPYIITHYNQLLNILYNSSSKNILDKIKIVFNTSLNHINDSNIAKIIDLKREFNTTYDRFSTGILTNNNAALISNSVIALIQKIGFIELFEKLCNILLQDNATNDHQQLNIITQIYGIIDNIIPNNYIKPSDNDMNAYIINLLNNFQMPSMYYIIYKISNHLQRKYPLMNLQHAHANIIETCIQHLYIIPHDEEHFTISFNQFLLILSRFIMSNKLNVLFRYLTHIYGGEEYNDITTFVDYIVPELLPEGEDTINNNVLLRITQGTTELVDFRELYCNSMEKINLSNKLLLLIKVFLSVLYNIPIDNVIIDKNRDNINRIVTIMLEDTILDDNKPTSLIPLIRKLYGSIVTDFTGSIINYLNYQGINLDNIGIETNSLIENYSSTHNKELIEIYIDNLFKKYFKHQTLIVLNYILDLFPVDFRQGLTNGIQHVMDGIQNGNYNDHFINLFKLIKKNTIHVFMDLYVNQLPPDIRQNITQIQYNNNNLILYLINNINDINHNYRDAFGELHQTMNNMFCNKQIKIGKIDIIQQVYHSMTYKDHTEPLLENILTDINNGNPTINNITNLIKQLNINIVKQMLELIHNNLSNEAKVAILNYQINGGVLMERLPLLILNNNNQLNIQNVFNPYFKHVIYLGSFNTFIDSILDEIRIQDIKDRLMDEKTEFYEIYVESMNRNQDGIIQNFYDRFMQLIINNYIEHSIDNGLLYNLDEPSKKIVKENNTIYRFVNAMFNQNIVEIQEYGKQIRHNLFKLGIQNLLTKMINISYPGQNGGKLYVGGDRNTMQRSIEDILREENLLDISDEYIQQLITEIREPLRIENDEISEQQVEQLEEIQNLTDRNRKLEHTINEMEHDNERQIQMILNYGNRTIYKIFEYIIRYVQISTGYNITEDIIKRIQDGIQMFNQDLDIVTLEENIDRGSQTYVNTHIVPVLQSIISTIIYQSMYILSLQIYKYKNPNVIFEMIQQTQEEIQDELRFINQENINLNEDRNYTGLMTVIQRFFNLKEEDMHKICKERIDRARIDLEEEIKKQQQELKKRRQGSTLAETQSQNTQANQSSAIMMFRQQQQRQSAQQTQAEEQQPLNEEEFEDAQGQEEIAGGKRTKRMKKKKMKKTKKNIKK